MRQLNINQVSRDRFLLLLCAGFFIISVGCGVKGLPVAPKATVPPAIEDLEAEVTGDRVRLAWSVAKEGEVPFEGLEHFRVYKYMAPVTVELCEGCPIPFKHILDIKLKDPAPAMLEGDRMFWNDTIEAAHCYAYKVVVFHKSGGVSEDSNIVQFVTEP